jgi:glycosyltransferase involved in cell wall biosynthesis
MIYNIILVNQQTLIPKIEFCLAVPAVEVELIDVIIRTKNSEELLKECIQSIYEEIPIRRIIMVDAGSTDKTLEIGSSFDKVCVYIKPELNLGQATKYAFTKAQTEWVAIIDSDIILRRGWYDDMKRHMNEVDAVEGCRIDHYKFETRIDTTKSTYGRFGQTLLKREPVLSMDLDLPFGEDVAISFNFKKQNMKWKKVENYLADHYPKVEGTSQRRTGIVFKPDPHIIHIPKKIQIEQGHIARRYSLVTKKQALNIFILSPIYEAYWAFKKNFWFCLAFFRII